MAKSGCYVSDGGKTKLVYEIKMLGIFYMALFYVMLKKGWIKLSTASIHSYIIYDSLHLLQTKNFEAKILSIKNILEYFRNRSMKIKKFNYNKTFICMHSIFSLFFDSVFKKN